MASTYRLFFPFAISLLLLLCRDYTDPVPSTHPGSVAIMWYNVQNCFDHVRDGNEYPEYLPDSCNWTASVCTRKITNIARAIASASPDIVVLGEIENSRTLHHLRTALHRCGSKRYPYACIKPYALTATHPACLSRYPIVHSRALTISLPGSSESTREVLCVDIELFGDTLHLLGNHWPSKYHPPQYRIRAARAVRDHIDSLYAASKKKCYLLIAGDLNTNYDEAERILFASTSRKNTKSGYPEHTPLCTTLSIIRSDSGSLPEYHTARSLKKWPRQKGAGSFYSPWPRKSPHQRCSYVYRNRIQTLDHFLISPDLMRGERLFYIPGSFSIHTWNGRLIKDAKPYAWQRRYSSEGMRHSGKGYSDHLPLIIDIGLRPHTGSTYTHADVNNWFYAGIVDTETQAPVCSGTWKCVHPSAVVVHDEHGLYTSGSCDVLIYSPGHNRNHCVSTRSITLPGTQIDSTAGFTICFRIKGYAKSYWKVTYSDNDKSHYFIRNSYTRTRYPRYHKYQYADWRDVRLRLPGSVSANMLLRLQLHAYARTSCKLWIRDLHVLPSPQ